MAPHNLGEVIAAARHLIDNPEATLDALMRFVPGPDLPTGGKIIGLDGVRDAYQSGRGTFRTRAATRIEKISPRRTGIVVTELPYNIGPEKVVARIKDLVQAKKLAGIADLKDLTDRQRGLHLVIEVRSGFHAEAVLEELYRLTPMEESFGINNVAIVDGQPRVLGLRELLQVYVDHRIEVVRRRSEFRRRKREERLHLVDGLLIALLNIDEVIQVIRASENPADAKQRLMDVFELSEIQAQYILDTPLRRLTKYDRLELERERETLRSEIADLTAILDSDARLRAVVSGELADIAGRFATPRRTVLLEGPSAAPKTAAVPLEVADDPCTVLLSATGLIARSAVTGSDAGDADDPERLPLTGPHGDGAAVPVAGPRGAHDVISSVAPATARGSIGVVTSAGRLIRLSVLELPALPPAAHAPGLAGGAPLAEFIALAAGETVVGLASLAPDGPALTLGTAQGVVKRVTSDYPQARDEFEVIALKDGDKVVGRGRGGRHRRPGVRDERRAVAALRRRLGPAAGPRGRGDGGDPAVRTCPRRVVRLRRCPRRRRGRRGGHGRRPRRSPARHGRRQREGRAVRRFPAEGPRHGRGPLPPVPQGRG